MKTENGKLKGENGKLKMEKLQKICVCAKFSVILHPKYSKSYIMKKLFLILTLGSLLLAPMAMAQVQPGNTTYSVSLHMGYGHNLTYGSMANFDIEP